MLTKYYDSMTKRDPFDIICNDLFPDIFRDAFDTGIKRTSRRHRVETTDVEQTLSVDLPGVKPGNVEVNTIDQRLSITYDLRGRKETQEYDIHGDYDASAAEATLENGVLEVRFPRAAKTRGRKIEVKVK